MFKGISNLASLLQNASELNSKMQAFTEELKTKRVTGSAGGGMVTVEVNGLCEVVRVKIDPGLLAKGDFELIEGLIPPAVNQAVTKAKELHMEMARSATKDIPMPGLEEALSKILGK